MTGPTLTRRGEETRSRLLDAAAAELIERDGALEVASVAGRAGVSVGLLYRYFGSKAGLVAAVVDDFYDRFEAEISEVDLDHDLDWAARERRRVERTVAFHCREPLAPVILLRLAREPEVADVEMRRIAGLIENATRGVHKAQRRGEIPSSVDATVVAAVVIGGFRVAIAESLTRTRPPDQAALAEQLWHFMVGGVRWDG